MPKSHCPRRAARPILVQSGVNLGKISKGRWWVKLNAAFSRSPEKESSQFATTHRSSTFTFSSSTYNIQKNRTTQFHFKNSNLKILPYIEYWTQGTRLIIEDQTSDAKVCKYDILHLNLFPPTTPPRTSIRHQSLDL